MNTKKAIRKAFRDACFSRDRYSCICCGFKSSPENAEKELDAHHITNRNEFENGGYVKENGASLCAACHLEAEGWLRFKFGPEKYSPESLYYRIDSSLELAIEKDKENGIF